MRIKVGTVGRAELKPETEARAERAVAQLQPHFPLGKVTTS